MVKISNDAMEYIERKIAQFVNTRLPDGRDIPLLAWASKAYFEDKAGIRTDYEPHFVFGWTNTDEINQYDYLALSTANGRTLALAPGRLFRANPCNIVKTGDSIRLVSEG